MPKKGVKRHFWGTFFGVKGGKSKIAGGSPGQWCQKFIIQALYRTKKIIDMNAVHQHGFGLFWLPLLFLGDNKKIRAKTDKNVKRPIFAIFQSKGPHFSILKP